MDLIKGRIIDNYKINILIFNEEIIKKQALVSSENVKLFGNNKFSNFKNNFLHLVYIDYIEKNGEIKRNKDILELLLMKGANINIKNDELGVTLLHIAFYNEELDIVRLLLDYGADVNIKDNIGENALHKTIMNKNLKKTEKLDILKLLLNHSKINLNLGDKNGKIALHRTVKLNNLKIVNELLTNPNSKNFIFVNALNNFKVTPLHYASVDGHIDIIKLLLGHGANPNYQNNNGNSPIYFAKKKKKIKKHK